MLLAPEELNDEAKLEADREQVASCGQYGTDPFGRRDSDKQ